MVSPGVRVYAQVGHHYPTLYFGILRLAEESRSDQHFHGSYQSESGVPGKGSSGPYPPMKETPYPLKSDRSTCLPLRPHIKIHFLIRLHHEYCHSAQSTNVGKIFSWC